MRTKPAPRNFIGGELAPWMDGLYTELTQKGARRLENFIVKKQGAIIRRPGTYYVNAVKDSADATILIPCEIDSDNIYVLEVGDAYIRFYKDHAQVSLAAAAYEVTSPWSTGEVADLRWCYIPNEKAMYFAHPKHAVRKLAWTSDANWALGQVYLRHTIPWNVAGSNNNMLRRTKDFQNYEELTIPISILSAIYFRTGEWFKDKYIVAGGILGSGRLYESADTDLWVNITPAGMATTNPYEMAANDDMAICSMQGRSGLMYVSYDGSTWLENTGMPSVDFGLVKVYNPIIWSETNKVWRWACREKSAYSTDGIVWVLTTETTPGTSASVAINDLTAWSTTMWGVGLCSGTLAAVYRAASTAAAFSLVQTCETGRFYAMAIGRDDPPIWMAVGEAGKVFISSNGAAWISITSGTTDDIPRVYWTKEQFVAFTDTGKQLTSPDGETWAITTKAELYNTLNDVYAPFLIADSDPLFDTEYPRRITGHEGRLIFAATEEDPATLWGSKVNDLNNFYPGTELDEGWSYSLNADRNIDIQWVLGGTDLVVGTRTAEGVLRGGPDYGITPSSARFLWQSTFGSDNVQPVRVHDHIIFVQRGGEIIRGYVPGAGAQAYQSPDLTAVADHIAAGGVKEIDHQDDPQTIVWFVRNDGELLALTFEGQTIAWSRIVTDGDFESIAIVPTDGAEDEIWAVVNRTINGATVRYIEYFDTLNVLSKNYAHFVDSGVHMSSASAITQVTGLTHLHAKYVDVCIDGSIVEKSIIVTSTGTAALSFSTGLHVHAGLPYRSYAQSMRMETGSPWGSGSGLSKRGGGKLFVWVHETIGGEYGPNISTTEAVVYSAGTALTTDLLEVDFPGDWNRDGYLWVIQQDPLPMTVVGYAPDVMVGDR